MSEPTPSLPLTGGCGCGAVRFEISQPFASAGYCHCGRCQRRTGTAVSASARVAASALTIVEGEEAVRTWRPPGGLPKCFCGECGGHVFGGDVGGDGDVVVRFGALDQDPGIRPQWHQWVSSAASWEPIPDDGLPRFPERRPA